MLNEPLLKPIRTYFMSNRNFLISFYKAVIISLCLSVFVTACKKDRVLPDPFPIAPPVVADTTPISKSYLALGDSYTIGSSVSIEERFPVQTRTRLMLAGLKMSQPNIIAVSGWTTGSLLGSLNQQPPANNYDVVTLLIGVNNQYQGRSQEEYRTQFSTLLDKAIVCAGGRRNRVFVLSIPDYSVMPVAQNSDTAKISREINEFNAINKQITQAAGIAYLDITPISREARQDPSLIAGDGLHPSGKQYAQWSALLFPLIQAAF